MTPEKEQLAKELNYVLGDSRGVDFLRRVVGRCGVYRSSFSPDALVMSRAEGERNIGLWIISLVAGHENGQYTNAITGVSNGRKRTNRSEHDDDVANDDGYRD
jgi:hypothetical protein